MPALPRPPKDAVFFAFLAVLLALLVLPQAAAPGTFDDDGIYLLGALSLASGEGYRALHLPGEPHQTKYPPLFPLLLSLLVRAGADPASAAGLRLLLLPGLLAAAGAGALFAGMLRRLGLPAACATLVVLASLLDTRTLFLLSMTLTEMPFALLAAAALLAARRGGLAGAAGCGAFCGLAALTRGIGMALPAGFFLAFLARRRPREAWVVVLVAGAFLAPWWLWRSAAAAANGALAQDVSLVYDLDYMAWVLGPAEHLRVAWQNLLQSAFYLATMVLPGASRALHGMVQSGGWRLACVWALVLVVLAAFAAGALRLFTRKDEAIGWMLLCYGAVVLAWPFEPLRFYEPLRPLLVGAVLAGAGLLVRDARRRGRVQTAAAAAVLLLALVHLVPWGASSEGRWRIREDRGARAIESLVEVVRRTAPPSEPVLVARGPLVTLRTGHKTLRLWPFDDPMVRYQPDRSPADFFFGWTPRTAELAAPAARVRQVVSSARNLGARHVFLVERTDLLAELIWNRWAERLHLPHALRDPEAGIRVVGLSGAELERFLREAEPERTR